VRAGQCQSPWTVESARSEATQMLGQAANGGDPALEKHDLKKRLPVAELCDQYLLHGCGTRKASTLATDDDRIERHVKPLLGRKKVRDVTRADVKRFLQDVAQGSTSADTIPAKAAAPLYGEAKALRRAPSGFWVVSSPMPLIAA
jgi:hypothetical protein